MLDLKGIKKSLKKLKRKNEPGDLKIEEAGRPETRYSYYLDGQMVFTFGLTRSSKAKSKRFRYVPQQMGLTTQEYKNLHDCPWNKRDFNKKIYESGSSEERNL